MNQFTFSTQKKLEHKPLDNVPQRERDLFKHKDWNQIVSDKLIKKISKYREERMSLIRDSKEEIINQIRHEDFMDNYCKEDSILLSEYFDKILVLFESNLIGQYELEIATDRNISTCPFCFYPAIFASNKICCLNLCFDYSLSNRMINVNFSVDNFIDLLNKTYQTHKTCIKSPHDIKVLQFEDDLNIVCGPCLQQM